MSVFIQNSLTKKKEEFVPRKEGEIKMYTCGVTVYDDCHIGHARSLYIFDCIRRYLEYRGFKVEFVRNITDIDDKIINRARELNIGWKELVEKYIARYYEDLSALGVEKGDFEPRATENIPEMIAYIRKLIEKGFAYTTKTGVYFSVRKFQAYGKLSGQVIEEMLGGTKKETDETKQDSLDFALWKMSKEGEPFWESPWGNGRPGWHIECSVMSQKFLKTQTLDIHAGGRDLIFPHHENEIAQAEALTGKPFANYWIHHGLLTINAQKMAKSLGNFITIKDFLAKYHNPDFLKLFFLSAHYSQPIDYTEKKIEDAKKEYERIDILMRKIKHHEPYPEEKSDEKFKDIEDLKAEFVDSMDDDFNTANGLGVIFKLVTLVNKNIDNLNFVRSGGLLLREFLRVFGMSLTMAIPFTQTFYVTSQVEGVVEDLIEKRNIARQNKDYALSDKIRIELEGKGIVLEDTKEGTTWRRKI